MTAVIDALLYLFAALLLVPVAVLLTQVVCALLARPATGSGVDMPRPRIAVLVPAHNEAAGLPATLQRIKEDLGPDDRILVVADNCSDETAAVARQYGAEAIERRDEDLRGKGYALDYGVRHLALDPPPVVVIVDADCSVLPGALDRIARLCAASDRPVQACYLMNAAPQGGHFGRIAAFAWLVKNFVRPLGFLRLGLPCQLMGSGMAFSWEAISAAPLATGHIVEDMQMGVDFARRGMAPLFCPEARVESEFPVNRAGSDSQRKRWEHGHLGMIVREVPGLVWEGIRHGRRDLLALALDLCVPPVALLVMLTSGLVVLSALGVLVGSSVGTLAFAATLLVMLAAAVGLAWWRFGRRVVSFSSLLLAVLYALRKIPLYAAFVVRRQVSWVRSKRDAEHVD